jgi:peptide/nickel transport system permease protein
MTVNAPVAVLDADKITLKEESPFQLIVRRFRRHKLAMISLFVMIAIFLLSIFAPWIAPFKPQELNVNNYFVPFGTKGPDGRVHWLGTDNLGRDYFSRILYAGRITLTVAVSSVIISELLGIMIGAISGFFRGITDAIIMRFVEFLITIPTLPLLLIISSMLMQNENLIPIPVPILQIAGKVMLLTERDARQAVLIIIILAGLGWMGSTDAWQRAGVA